MINRFQGYYDLLGTSGLGFTNASFQAFVDKFYEKYNGLKTDGFDWDDEIQIDFTYEQLQAELGIATLPTYVDVDAGAPYKSQDTFIIGSNKIPRFKHGFAMNEKIIREQMILAKRFGGLSADVRNVLMKLLFDSVDKLIVGNHNGLTYQRNQIVSKREFTIDSSNNPQGIKGLTFSFGINAEAKITTARWWTNATHSVANQGSASDPLKDMKDVRKKATGAGVPMGHFEMSKVLFDDLLTHTKVLSRIGYALYPNASAEENAITYAQNLAEDAAKAAIERIIGAPLKVIDARAVVEKYNSDKKAIVKESIDSFDSKRFAYVPDGTLGTIKAVEPIAVADPAARIAYFDGGRTIIKNVFNTDTNTQYVYSECTALVVPSVAKYMYSVEVTV